MGYHTVFSLDVRTANDAASHPRRGEIIAQLRKGNEYAACALNEKGATLSDTTWYASVEDIKGFSREFSDALFVLYGDGEGNEDFWCAYLRNGQEQFSQGRIEYDEFDEDK